MTKRHSLDMKIHTAIINCVYALVAPLKCTDRQLRFRMAQPKDRCFEYARVASAAISKYWKFNWNLCKKWQPKPNKMMWSEWTTPYWSARYPHTHTHNTLLPRITSRIRDANGDLHLTFWFHSLYNTWNCILSFRIIDHSLALAPVNKYAACIRIFFFFVSLLLLCFIFASIYIYAHTERDRHRHTQSHLAHKSVLDLKRFAQCLCAVCVQCVYTRMQRYNLCTNAKTSSRSLHIYIYERKLFNIRDSKLLFAYLQRAIDWRVAVMSHD